MSRRIDFGPTFLILETAMTSTERLPLLLRYEGPVWGDKLIVNLCFLRITC